MNRTRRRALHALAAGAVAPFVISSRAQGTVPVSGRALPGMEALDNIVLPIMEAHGVPGCAVAIAHEGKLKLVRGYGYADLQSRTPMRPDTRIALASVSKVLTAQTI